MGFAGVNLLLIATLISQMILVWVLIRLLINSGLSHQTVSKIDVRSNHTGYVPQIGGVALVPSTIVCLTAYLVLTDGLSTQILVVVFAALAIGLMGYLDDRYRVGVLVRLCVQFAVAAVLVMTFSQSLFAPEYLFSSQAWILTLLFTLITVYWINAVNFMDGLDMMLVIGLGVPLAYLSVILWMQPDQNPLSILGIISVAGLISFAIFNWPPARIFMGDSGSLFLGAISAVTILVASSEVSIVVATLPFLYFAADTATTILMRLKRRENIFRAHSQHAYQSAFRRGMSVTAIVFWVFATTILLCLLSAAALAYPSAVPQMVIWASGMVIALLQIYVFRRPGD